ncbi:MAG: hypothetical protein JWO36_4810 [Myxococcales bacterium]|nr:hypothetical protein [Myxococcales bacterium]
MYIRYQLRRLALDPSEPSHVHKHMTSRVLRVGVLIRDHLVEERIFDGATPVTFGQSLRCALSIPVDGVPREHVLFARDQGRWILRPLPTMEGRLGQRDKIDVVTPKIESRGHAPTLGPNMERGGLAPTLGVDIPLEQGARGKLRIGEATILFQEIAARPKAPRPRLPASVRGTFADRIDKRLAVIVGGSILLHIGIAAWAWAIDRETTPLGASPVATYQQETIDILMPPETPPVPTTTAPGQPGVAMPNTRHPRPISITSLSHPSPSSPVDPSHFASLLTGGEGAVGVGGMHNRRPGADLDHQLDEIRRNGGHVTIGDNGHNSRSDDRAHIDDHRHDIGIGDPTITETPPPRHDEDPIRIKIATTHTDTTTTLTPESVIERISTVYMAGLKRCYRKALVTDATLSGKVGLTFTVDDRGHVTDPEAAGITSAVDACISAQMGGWHFSTPKDKSGNPTEVNFHVVLALQPS